MADPAVHLNKEGVGGIRHIVGSSGGGSLSYAAREPMGALNLAVVAKLGRALAAGCDISEDIKQQGAMGMACPPQELGTQDCWGGPPALHCACNPADGIIRRAACGAVEHGRRDARDRWPERVLNDLLEVASALDDQAGPRTNLTGMGDDQSHRRRLSGSGPDAPMCGRGPAR